MKIVLSHILNNLKANPNHIYLWVVTEPDGSTVSIRIGYDEAVEWCIEYANEHDGMVPCFTNSIETFLGYAPVK